MTPQEQAAQIQKARDATTLLRDHARDGVPLHHFKRDPAVVAIHSALDSLKAISSALAEKDAELQRASKAHIGALELEQSWQATAREQERRAEAAEAHVRALSADLVQRTGEREEALNLVGTARSILAGYEGRSDNYSAIQYEDVLSDFRDLALTASILGRTFQLAASPRPQPSALGLQRYHCVYQTGPSSWEYRVKRPDEAPNCDDLVHADDVRPQPSAGLQDAIEQLRVEIAEHCASFFWNDIDIGLLHANWRDRLAALRDASVPLCRTATPSVYEAGGHDADHDRAAGSATGASEGGVIPSASVCVPLHGCDGAADTVAVPLCRITDEEEGSTRQRATDVRGATGSPRSSQPKGSE